MMLFLEMVWIGRYGAEGFGAVSCGALGNGTADKDCIV